MKRRFLKRTMLGFVIMCNCLLNSKFLLEKQVFASGIEQVEYGVMADKIVVRTRLFEGKLQFRRFNATKERWVDPDWINAEDFDGCI